ncbi:MAG: hypothetical protein QM655_00170 [Nocardioidaceae bacterium]
MERTRLAPGVPVLRRADGSLQLGYDARHSVPIGGADPRPTPVSLLPEKPARHGYIKIMTFGPSGPALSTQARALVAGADQAQPGVRTDVLLVAGAGEPRRRLLDGAMSAGTAQVLVRFIEGSAYVGPFVLPGSTACLRCIDAAETDRDPSWPVLLEQYCAFSETVHGDGSDEVVEHSLAALALAWAVRDAQAFIAGRRPSTWSATLRLDPWLRDISARSWRPHPSCGCAWTMEV